MKIQHIATLDNGQDGAIWGDLLFRFDEKGFCCVYDLNCLGADAAAADVLAQPISEFMLDKVEQIVPHSNSVSFGVEYYAQEDEFPLLYSNIYNTYAKSEQQLKGVCCVYRIQRNGDAFSSKLVQLIEIGFVEDSSLWCSAGEQADIRPYGNFVVDRKNSLYYGFTMRDATQTTRYFSFKLPALADGEMDELFGVRKVVLNPSDILDSFDCEYHHFVQGACVHDGKIYSLEGFTKNAENPPAIRVIVPQEKRQELHKPFAEFDMNVEPEFIDFRGEVCYYGDRHGGLYNISFDE